MNLSKNVNPFASIRESNEENDDITRIAEPAAVDVSKETIKVTQDPIVESSNVDKKDSPTFIKSEEEKIENVFENDE